MEENKDPNRLLKKSDFVIASPTPAPPGERSDEAIRYFYQSKNHLLH
jgi:hypothetical protein